MDDRVRANVIATLLKEPTLTVLTADGLKPEKVGCTDGMGGQPSREELISVIAALIEPRVGGDKKAQLARARQAARRVLARTPVAHRIR